MKSTDPIHKNKWKKCIIRKTVYFTLWLIFFFFCILHKIHPYFYIYFYHFYDTLLWYSVLQNFSSESNCLSHVHATIWKKGQYIGSTPKSLVVIVLYTIKYNKEAKLAAVYFTFRKKKNHKI